MDDWHDLDDETFLMRLAARRVERSAGELIYKTHETPLPMTMQRVEAMEMDAESSKAWNRWVMQHLEEFAHIIGEEVGSTQRQLRDELSARIDQVESRLDDLESRVADLEGGGAEKGAVIPMKRA